MSKLKIVVPVWVSILAAALCPRATAGSLREGIAIDLDGRAVTLKKLDTLSFVESDYTRRFKFDSYENPRLKELRTRYKLDEVVAPGKDEFDRQVLLMDWTHQQFKKFPDRPDGAEPLRGGWKDQSRLQDADPELQAL